jgi:hypothetical protein
MNEDQKLIRHLLGLKQEANSSLMDVHTIVLALGEIIRRREGTDNEFYGNLHQTRIPRQAVPIIDAYISHVRGGFSKKKSTRPVKDFVNKARLEKLRLIKHPKFDLTRLIRYCEELNLCSTMECHLSVVMLVRAIIDHTPPIFDVKNFAGVVANYSGSKSFKESMEQLDKVCRKIADDCLHVQIRRKESLPNATQVDFSHGLDMLLAEIVRRLE